MTEMLKPSYEYGKKDRRKIRFKIETPIHIGTKDGKLIGLEFITHNMETYVVDDQKLGEFLREKALIDDFVGIISESASPVLLSKFFEQKGKKNEIPYIAKS